MLVQSRLLFEFAIVVILTQTTGVVKMLIDNGFISIGLMSSR